MASLLKWPLAWMTGQNVNLGYRRATPPPIKLDKCSRVMAATHGCTSSSKVKVVVLVCLLALGANYLLFVHYGSQSAAVRLFSTFNGHSDVNDESVPVVKIQELEFTGNINLSGEGTNQPAKPEEKKQEGENKPTEEKPKAKPDEKAQVKPEVKNASPPECPVKPPGLVGQIKTFLDPISISEVEKKYPEMEKGSYQPSHCWQKEKLALIIPCRNRTSHLHVLLHNLVGVLMKQQAHFTIFVIDQDFPTTFNRGMLFNVGFMEALKRDSYDCFVFHDVDMIPTNDLCMYRCTHNPRHFLAGVSKWNYALPYGGYYGGVVGFSREQFQKINGDSNLYFGWGGEDDDLRIRVLNKGYSLVRYPKQIGRYDTISHKRDSGNKANSVRFQLVDKAKLRQDEEGLSTTKYKVTEVKEEKLYVKIKVFINMTEIIQAALPKVNYLKPLLADATKFDKEMTKAGGATTSPTKNNPKNEIKIDPKISPKNETKIDPKITPKNETKIDPKSSQQNINTTKKP